MPLPEEQIRWLIQNGRAALDTIKILSARPLRIDWNGSKLADWQQAILEEQVQLRQRCASRFPDADRWLWTDRSLQQASDWFSAQAKTKLFLTGSRIVDACCGAGADLVALAEHYPVLAVDRDRSMLQLARSNMSAHGLASDYVCAELPRALGSLRDVCLHADPDRRRGQQRETRTTHADAFSPPLSDVLTLGQEARACVIKLAPATELEPDKHEQWRRAWLGSGRECPQQLLMRGELNWLIAAGEHGAMLAEHPELPFTGTPNEQCATTDEPDQFMFEPHAALYAAGLAAAWSEQNNLVAIPQPGSYFTGDSIPPTPWAQSFKVLAHMSWDERRVRKWLKANRIGTVEVKTRQVPLDANLLQRQLSQQEGDPISCLLFRVGKSIRIAMTQRMAQ